MKSRALLGLLGVSFLLLGVARSVAQQCTQLSGVFSATILGNTSGQSTGSGSCGGNDAPEATFFYYAPRTGTYTIDTNGSLFDTVLYVRNDQAQELICNDDIATDNRQSLVTLHLDQGQFAMIVVDGYDATSSGSLTLRVNGNSPRPQNDDPRDLGSSLSVSVNGNTMCGSYLAHGASCGAGGDNAPDATFLYAVPIDGTYTIDTIGSSFDTVLSVREQKADCNGTELPGGCNDDIDPPADKQSRVILVLAAGKTIIVNVDGYLMASGAYSLNINGIPFTPTRTTTASPTLTRTSTPSRTPTQSPTITITRTPTSSSTAIPTRTATATRTATRTPTPTRSVTPSASPSATASPSTTRTETVTKTPSRSATATASRSPTVTLTVTRTLSATVPPTATHSATASSTPIATQTVTATATNTSAPTASATPTASVTLTGTATGTRTFSPTATGTVRASATPSPTRSAPPSAVASATRSPTLTATPSPTATITRRATATAAPEPTRATISVTPGSGIAGGVIDVSGSVTAGARSVRILWDSGGIARGLADGGVDGDGHFHLGVTVPTDAVPGTVRVCALATAIGARGRDVRCTAFTVLATPPGSITGLVADQSGAPVVGAEVRLTTDTGAPVATATTDSHGSYIFPAVDPGIYGVDARCPPSETCASGTFFPPGGVMVSPGGEAGRPIVGLPPPLDSATLVGFGGIALPGGSLGGADPVRVTSGLTGVVAQLGSLEGRGVLPLTVRFWADVLFFDELSRTKTVRFQIFQGSEVVALKTASAPQAVGSADPYAFSAYVFDINVNELPAGDLTLRITPFLGGFALAKDDFTIRMIDLGGRWFNDTITSPAVAITAGGGDDLLYNFTGTIAAPAFDFHNTIDLPFDTHLDNIVTLGIPVAEMLHTNTTWDGTAKATARVTLLSLDFLNETRSYKGPSGASFAESTYQLDTIHKDLFGKKCFPIPQLYYCAGFSVDPCPVFSCSIGVGVWLTTDICFQGFIDLDSQIKDTLRVNATVTAGTTVSVPIELKIDATVCKGNAKAEPSATATLPIYYDPDRSPLFGFDDPCLDLTASLEYKVSCVGITVIKGSTGLGELKYGCSTALMTPMPRAPRVAQSDAFTIADVSPSPSVASDGAGHALAVWIEEDSPDPAMPDRRLHFSFYDGSGWTAPAPLNNERAMIEAPKVKFLGPDHALAVWVQSRLSLEEALASNQAGLLSSSELYFSVWDGHGWSTPAAITNDMLLDVAPSLAADPSTGTAALVWLRAHANVAAGEYPIGVYSASFDGAQWSAPTAIGARSAAFDHPPAVQFDRQGRPVALWVRDTDGNFLTSEDRQIVMAIRDQSGWSVPAAIPNLPAGAYTPSFAFDAANNPVVVFVVPPIDLPTGRLGSGDGNLSPLYAAYHRNAAWEVGPIGHETRAERPIVRVNPDNRVIVMFRQFGDTGDVHVSGDLAAATADLTAPALQWTSGFLTADGQVNWEVAFDIDALTLDNVVLNVKKPSSAAAAARPIRYGAGIRAAQQAAGSGVNVATMVVPYMTDLMVEASDVTFSNSHPLAGDTIQINATVHNSGLKAVAAGSGFGVSFYDEDPATGVDTLIARPVVTSGLPFNGAVAVSTPYVVQPGGLHAIRVIVDENNVIAEADESNNSVAVALGQVPPPENLSGRSDNSDQPNLRLRWQTPETAGIANYLVYRSSTSGSGYELVGSTVDVTFDDLLAARSQPYFYAVAAVDQYGVISPLSNEVHVQLGPPPCVGDCDESNSVTVDELIIGVNVALGLANLDACPTFDGDMSGTVTVDELIVGVNNALGACSDR
jgi:hypothetical protein